MISSSSRLAISGELRVETRVFRGGDKQPFAKLTSWVLDARSYDQNHADDRQITIFDSESRQIVLLSPATKRRTSITYDELLQFIAATTTRTEGMTSVVRFASAPKFEEQWNEQSQRLYLTHELMSYSAKLMAAPSAEAAHQYQSFTDWAARLNTMCPGLPPAARLKLNLAIADRTAVPVSVRRTTPGSNGVVTDIISRHRYEWQLTEEDRAQLAVFDDWANSFQFVDYKSFRQPASPSADDQQ